MDKILYISTDALDLALGGALSLDPPGSAKGTNLLTRQDRRRVKFSNIFNSASKNFPGRPIGARHKRPVMRNNGSVMAGLVFFI